MKERNPPKSNTVNIFQLDKFINFKGKSIRLYHNPVDGYWYDETGTAYGLRDNGDITGKEESRAGAGPFLMPKFFYRINDYVRAHDNKYSIPIYQAYHSRAEADSDLENDIKYLADPSFISRSYYGILGRSFRILASIFGGLGGVFRLWENKKTRNLITIKGEENG